MKKVIIQLALAYTFASAASAQTFQGNITDVKADTIKTGKHCSIIYTVTIDGCQTFLVAASKKVPAPVIGQYATFTGTNNSDRQTRRKVNAAPIDTTCL